jgi:hypothetical protein
MSADNRICILQISDNEWAVWHGSGSCEYYQPDPCGVSYYHTEKEARASAFAWEKELGYVEYGVQMITPGEQKQALEDEIKYLREKLELLKKTGKQYRTQR